MSNQGISRRSLLKGAGVGALSLGLFGLQGRPASAAAAAAQEDPMAASPVLGVYNFQLGDWTMSVIKDANIAPDATVFGANQDPETVYALFRDAQLLNDDNTVPVLVDILVARSADQVILFDAGLGAGGPGGRLASSLSVLGLSTDDVTHIVNTHWHFDHITGISNEGVLTYPNAAVLVSQPEYDFLQAAPDELSADPLSRLQPAMDADQLSFYGDEDEVVSGVMAMAAYGHTPGHMAMMLESNGERLLNMVDSTLNVFATLPNPTWESAFDADGPTAVETRLRILGMAADEKIKVFGYHFPFPGVGYIDRDGEGFRFIPASL